MNYSLYSIEDYLQAFRARMRSFKRPVLLPLFTLLVIWLASGIYQVKEGHGAVILRLGKFVRVSGPGLNYRLPFPFERHICENLSYSRRIEIGYRSRADGNYIPEESNILTSDENVVRLKCDVTWHIKSLPDYVFSVVAPQEATRRVAQSAVREVISDSPISDILSNKKQEIGVKIEALTQRVLDQYVAGVEVEKVSLLGAEPPSEVIDAYRDVQSSRADKEREINQACGYRNDIVTRAEGDAVKILQDAEAYKEEVIAAASGDTKRFEQVLNQALSHKELTRFRIYSETIEKVLKDKEKIIADGGILPHLKLNPNKQLTEGR